MSFVFLLVKYRLDGIFIPTINMLPSRCFWGNSIRICLI